MENLTSISKCILLPLPTTQYSTWDFSQLITRGNITLIPKEATQEKEKENLKLQPEKLKKKEKEE